jgi:uncharacterized membrane protein
MTFACSSRPLLVIAAVYGFSVSLATALADLGALGVAMVPVVVFLPGLLWMAGAAGVRVGLGALEVASMSVALSLGIGVVGGVALNAAGVDLDRSAWAVFYLFIVTLLAAFALLPGRDAN